MIFRFRDKKARLGRKKQNPSRASTSFQGESTQQVAMWPKHTNKELEMQTANIGASIIEAQHVKRMTTVELANKLRESRQAVYYTRRQKSASIHKVQQLAEIFGYTVDEFIALGISDA